MGRSCHSTWPNPVRKDGPVYCKCAMRGGRPAFLVGRMSLAGVQVLRCNFSKPKYLDSGPKYFRFQPKFFCICKFVQKKEFFSRLILGLRGLQVKKYKATTEQIGVAVHQTSDAEGTWHIGSTGQHIWSLSVFLFQLCSSVCQFIGEEMCWHIESAVSELGLTLI